MDNLQFAPVTQCMNKAGTGAGTTTTISVANAVNYAIRSKLYLKAAGANQATPTIDITTKKAFRSCPVGSNTVYILGYDAAGNLQAAQGSIETGDGAGGFGLPPQFPVVDDTVCPIAYVLVRVATGGAPWTLGASATAGATGVTYGYQDIALVPDRPQIQ